MIQIDIQKEPSQIVKVALDLQRVQILIQQKPKGILVDVNLDGEDIVTGVLCLNENPIICREYLGFKGNLFFVDTLGKEDPHYTGLGSRFFLVYLNKDEYELVRK